MKKFLEQYFPVMRSHQERLFRWQRGKYLTSSQLSTSFLKVRKCVLRAPVREAAGSKVLFISDWHWFGSERNRMLLERVKYIVRHSEPSVIVLGGDMCEDADTLDKLPALLKELSLLAPDCIAVPGNWETGKRWLGTDFWKDLYASCNIKLLRNECYTAGALRFHGIDDITSGFCALPEKLDPEIPPAGTLPVAEILVAHSPDTIIALDESRNLYGFDTALCGHCHGGQLRLPLFGAMFCPSRYGTRFARGSFIRINTHLKMLVSSGIGERNGSFRFNCPPEVILLHFRTAHHYRARSCDMERAK
ncbi:MAG: metallophosphoesterase [Lentisphaeria bacterium]|nr:metallophosphoesterase [Lentisphaeria bacterium]